jgi:hypothetical protein
MIDNYVNGIHTIEDILKYLASEHISDVGYRQCGQIFFMADDLGISVGELEAICEYLGINLEDFEV